MSITTGVGYRERRRNEDGRPVPCPPRRGAGIGIDSSPFADDWVLLLQASAGLSRPLHILSTHSAHTQHTLSTHSAHPRSIALILSNRARPLTTPSPCFRIPPPARHTNPIIYSNTVKHNADLYCPETACNCRQIDLEETCFRREGRFPDRCRHLAVGSDICRSIAPPCAPRREGRAPARVDDAPGTWNILTGTCGAECAGVQSPIPRSLLDVGQNTTTNNYE